MKTHWGIAGLTLWLGGAGPTPRVSPGPIYQVHAIQYATLSGFPANALILGADSTRKIDLSMMVWLLQGEGRTILVDAGFYRDEFLKAWKVGGFSKPSEAVARFGVAPDQVTDIIISHMHWDHADGADLFPRAKVWVQRAEYQFYQDPKNQARTGVFPVDVAMFEKFEREGRLGLIDGDSQRVARGVFVYTGGRHTKESEYVSVYTTSGQTILASDNVYLFENLERHRPIAATWDTVSNLLAQDRMRRLAADPRLIVPGHDPAVFTRFKVIKPGVALIE